MLPAFSSLRSQFFTIQTNSKPVNNLLIFSKLSNEKKKHSRKKTCASVTVTMVRDRMKGLFEAMTILHDEVHASV